MGLRRCVEHVVGQCGSGAGDYHFVEVCNAWFGQRGSAGDFVEATAANAASAACSGEGWATAAIDATAYGGEGWATAAIDATAFEASGL